MAYTIEVKYFNSFWLKKTVEASKTLPQWPGLPWNPTGYPTFPFSGGTADPAASNYTPWFVEESRIRGGFSNTTVDYGVRAFVTVDEDIQVIRKSSLIYSGVYNSSTGVNRTNVFSVGESITRSADPVNGGIQKLYAEDSNLIIFQEHKVNRALIDKDTIYTAEGGTQTQSGAQVIGQIIPYAGEYGISKNPESFAVYGYRKYFTDKNKGVALRLSKDGITEISGYGMKDWFRDRSSEMSDEWTLNTITYPIAGSPSGSQTSFSVTTADCCGIQKGAQLHLDNVDTGSLVTNIVDAGSTCTITISPAYTFGGSETNANFVTQIKSRIVGGWDIYDQNYVVSLQETPAYVDTSTNYYTLNFDESSLGWVSFYTYKPSVMDSLQGTFYSFALGEVWKHNDESSGNNRGRFYGTTSSADITFVFNGNPSITKNFLTVNYEGTNGWEVESFTSSETGPDLVAGNYVNTSDTVGNTVNSGILSYDEGTYTDGGITYRAGFDRKENRYVANLINNSTQAIGEVVFGESMSGIKGYFATVKLKTDGSTQPGGMKELFSVGSNFVTSSY